MLEDYLQSIVDECKDLSSVIFCGDINDYRLQAPNFYEPNALTQLITFPTRGSSTLDVMAVTEPSHFKAAVRVGSLGLSDHYGFFVESKTAIQVTTSKVRSRSFTPASFARFREHLAGTDWHSVCLNKLHIDDSITSFERYLLALIDKYMPYRTVRMRSSDPVWFTPSLKALFDAKDRALHRGQFHKYNALRETFKQQIAKAKKRFAMKLSTTNPKDSWTVIKRCTRKSTDGHQIDAALAHQMNDTLAQQFESEDILEFELTTENDDSHSSEGVMLANEDVLQAIKGIRSNAPGWDGISGSIYKTFAAQILVPLKCIFQRCMEDSYFPLIWRRANVKLLPKSEPNEYRPISLLPFASKVYEKLILRLIIKPSLKRPFNVQQFGFVPGKRGGCTNALATIRLHTLHHVTSTNGYARVIAFDFKKAFDKASHLEILKSLRLRFQCDNKALMLVLSYLTNRVQRVVTADTVCEWISVTSGVPQGSIIGPLLFVALVDDFEPLYDNTKCVAFADDFTMICKVGGSGVDVCQDEVHGFHRWACSKKLVINSEKTHVLTVSRITLTFAPPPLLLGNTAISEVQKLRILGVIFSHDAKWGAQVEFLLSKWRRSLWFVKSVWLAVGSGKLVWSAYVGLVFGIIGFCWPAICDLTNSQFKKFESLEKTALRWAQISGVNPLRVRLDAICLRLIKNVAGDRDNHPLGQFFVARDVREGLRQARALQSLPSRRQMFLKSFVKFSKFT